jgi:hypothetical protein
VLAQYRVNDGALGQRFAWLGLFFTFRFVVVDMEAQDVAVFDGVRDGVGV